MAGGSSQYNWLFRYSSLHVFTIFTRTVAAEHGSHSTEFAIEAVYSLLIPKSPSLLLSSGFQELLCGQLIPVWKHLWEAAGFDDCPIDFSNVSQTAIRRMAGLGSVACTSCFQPKIEQFNLMLGRKLTTNTLTLAWQPGNHWHCHFTQSHVRRGIRITIEIDF